MAELPQPDLPTRSLRCCRALSAGVGAARAVGVGLEGPPDSGPSVAGHQRGADRKLDPAGEALKKELPGRTARSDHPLELKDDYGPAHPPRQEPPRDQPEDAAPPP